MSNSTDEYWSLANLDGTNEISLHQWGWAVTTVGGSRYDLPPKRGSDIVMAYRPGQVFRRKVPDARTITLQMFMVGWDPGTGDAPSDIVRFVDRDAIDMDDELVKATMLTNGGKVVHANFQDAAAAPGETKSAPDAETAKAAKGTEPGLDVAPKKKPARAKAATGVKTRKAPARKPAAKPKGDA